MYSALPIRTLHFVITHTRPAAWSPTSAKLVLDLPLLLLHTSTFPLRGRKSHWTNEMDFFCVLQMGWPSSRIESLSFFFCRQKCDPEKGTGRLLFTLRTTRLPRGGRKHRAQPSLPASPPGENDESIPHHFYLEVPLLFFTSSTTTTI